MLTGLIALLGRAILILPVLASIQAKQIPFGTTKFQNEQFGEKYDSGLFTPLETLNALSETQFTTLAHPLFPNYSVRLKKSRFCDPTVNTYTGYIDIEARHLFFYFFESRSNPDKDDVIFWTNGGPGCSSSLGLFMELGPCRVINSTVPSYHPESWNSNANIFFIDQPVGVGFSYADHGESVSTSVEAAKDVAAFVSIFFEHFSQFKGRPFHMAGESYGGKYVPLFASAVYDQNAKLVEAGMTPINLTSIMIGNGMTDTYKMVLSYYDMQCTPASVTPFVDISSCVTMKTMVSRCEKWFQKSCIDQFDSISCGAAVQLCFSAFDESFYETGRNRYDVSKPCEGDAVDLCYPQTKFIREFLSDPQVRDNLGVDSAIPKNFTSCSNEVGRDFSLTLDIAFPTQDYVGALLDRGVRVLIYIGNYDYACNWVGNERWTLALKWSGQEEFVKQELRDWKLGAHTAGKTRSAKGFTFATIEGAGHLVPYDKPKESLEMVQRWLAGEAL